MDKKYTLYADLCLRQERLWQRVEQADAEGDEYHVALWMLLIDRLTAQMHWAIKAGKD